MVCLSYWFSKGSTSVLFFERGCCCSLFLFYGSQPSVWWLPSIYSSWVCLLIFLYLRFQLSCSIAGIKSLKFLSLIFIYLLCIQYSVCVHVCRSEEGTTPLNRWLWATMCLPGIELRTFGRVVSAFTLWAISPAPPVSLGRYLVLWISS